MDERRFGHGKRIFATRSDVAVRYLYVAKQISKADKTSMVIDREKMAEAQKILGTRTLAETVDKALDEVISLESRRRLLRRIEREGGLGPSPEELRRLRDPRA
jgi:Arc/MetJ family transcription regulator